MRPPLLLAPTLLLSALTLPAQTASYTTFGSGCASSVSSCPNSNGNVTQTPGSTHNSNIFAHPIVPKTNLVVLGFRYFNKAVGSAPVKVKTEIYKADTAGKPKNPPIATSVMIVTTKLGWHSTKFAKPLLFKKGEKFFISHLGGTSVTWSWDKNGVKSIHYWHPPTSTTWNGPFTSVAWAWRVDCVGGKTITALTNTGLPKIGNSFSVNVSNTLPNTGAALALGASKTKFLSLNLPFDLKALGAPGCNLNVSIDAIIPTVVGAQGTGQVKLSIPNDNRFLGIQFHNQYLVLDKAANNFGFTLSNGGTGVIGK